MFSSDPPGPNSPAPILPEKIDQPPNLAVPTPDWVDDLNYQSRSKKRNRQHLDSDENLNSLTQETLIQIIKDLQAENKSLLKILENATAASSNTQNPSVPLSNQEKEFSFTPSAPHRGNSNKKDFPSLKESATFASKTKHGKPTTGAPTPAKSQKKNFPRNSKPSAEAKQWALRLFTPPNLGNTQNSNSSDSLDAPPTGFTFVYLPSNRKTKQSELRTRLRYIGIKLHRVYSITHPAKNVVALLVHKSYAEDIKSLATAAGLIVNEDFNPTSGSIIGNPRLITELTPSQLDDKAKALYYNNILEATVQLPDPAFGLHLLKDFNRREITDFHHVPDILINQYIHLRPNAVRKPNASQRHTRLRGFDAATLFNSLKSVTPQPPQSTPTATGVANGNRHTNTHTNDGNPDDLPMDLN